MDFASLVDQAKAELAAEVSHSKSLQAKLATSTFASSSAAHAGGSGGSDRLREENESLKARLGLNEDLTGLQVTSMAEQPEGIVFSCIISDFLCKNGSESLIIFSFIRLLFPYCHFRSSCPIWRAIKTD